MIWAQPNIAYCTQHVNIRGGGGGGGGERGGEGGGGGGGGVDKKEWKGRKILKRESRHYAYIQMYLRGFDT